MAIAKFFLVSLLTAGLAITGCATPSSGKSYSRHEARTAWDVHYGEIVAVDDAVIEGRRTPLGRIGGGFIGY